MAASTTKGGDLYVGASIALLLSRVGCPAAVPLRRRFKEVSGHGELWALHRLGAVARGGEQRALEVFNESVQYYADLQKQGEIESFEVGLLEPHGGDLQGFVLLRGDSERLARLRRDREFQRRITRAALVVDKAGVVGALLVVGLTEGMADYQQEVGQL